MVENINPMCGEICPYSFLQPHKQLAKITKRNRHENKGLQHVNCLHHISITKLSRGFVLSSFSSQLFTT